MPTGIGYGFLNNPMMRQLIASRGFGVQGPQPQAQPLTMANNLIGDNMFGAGKKKKKGTSGGSFGNLLGSGFGIGQGMGNLFEMGAGIGGK